MFYYLFVTLFFVYHIGECFNVIKFGLMPQNDFLSILTLLSFFPLPLPPLKVPLTSLQSTTHAISLHALNMDIAFVHLRH